MNYYNYNIILFNIETKPCISKCDYASAIGWTILACVVIAAIGASGVVCCYFKRKTWTQKIKKCCRKHNNDKQITRSLTDNDKKGYS